MAMLWPTLEFVLGISLMITLLVGGHEVLLHHITVGQFTEFMVYMVQLTWPMIAIGWVVNLFQRGTASVVRIDELLKQQPSIADSADTPSSFAAGGGPASAACIQGSIDFRTSPSPTSEHPRPPRHQPHIPAGSSLAIVGPTGSGKSTLVNLIARLHDAAPAWSSSTTSPSAPAPCRPSASTSASSPRKPSSSPTPSPRTSAFGAPAATELQIEDAATIAHIRTEILEFPKGFSTVVGERGITLSGGQKQRTAIARAVIRNPRILILDDALASVDTYTEEQILSGLRTVMQGRTTILISHRVSTARNADQIAVLVERPHRRARHPRRAHRPRRLLHLPRRKTAAGRRARRHRVNRAAPFAWMGVHKRVLRDRSNLRVREHTGVSDVAV